MNKEISNRYWRLVDPNGQIFIAIPEKEAAEILRESGAKEIQAGRRIKLLRIERNLTQQDLAELSAISQGQISRIESGESGTKYTETISRLLSVLLDDQKSKA